MNAPASAGRGRGERVMPFASGIIRHAVIMGGIVQPIMMWAQAATGARLSLVWWLIESVMLCQIVLLPFSIVEHWPRRVIDSGHRIDRHNVTSTVLFRGYWRALPERSDGPYTRIRNRQNVQV